MHNSRTFCSPCTPCDVCKQWFQITHCLVHKLDLEGGRKGRWTKLRAPDNRIQHKQPRSGAFLQLARWRDSTARGQHTTQHNCGPP